MSSAGDMADSAVAIIVVVDDAPLVAALSSLVEVPARWDRTGRLTRRLVAAEIVASFAVA
jgi:hypothetical protein